MSPQPKSDWRPGANLAAIKLRAQLNAFIRRFFAERGVLEVETPILSAAGNTDPHIQSLSLELHGPPVAAPGRRWLRSSPEFALKRLLAAGLGDCYELGRVFRDGEAGACHNPEFTLLEWYRIGWDHRRLMEEVADLVQAALALVGKRSRVQRTSFRELYRRRFGFDPHSADEQALRAPLAVYGIDPVGLTRDDWLDLLMTHLIQPALPENRILLVHDYPASQCALARLSGEDPPLAERFEVYLGPLELANGYHELCEAGEQRRRFEADLAQRRRRGLPLPVLDERLLSALDAGLPACAGVALGVDRLLLAMLGGSELNEVLAFASGRA